MRRAAAVAAVASALAAPILIGSRAASAFDARDIPLVDQRGDRFSLRSLAGRPVAVTFVATRCDDKCPIASGIFARVAVELDRAGARGRLLTVTIDPEHDTPLAMATASRAFAPRIERWRWASGDPRDVARLLGAFGVFTSNAAHGTFVYLLGTDALPRRIVPLSVEGIPRLVAALR